MLSLLPQDLLEVVFQSLYYVTKKKGSSRQILSLFLHDISEQLPVPLYCLGVSWMQPESQVTSVRILESLVEKGWDLKNDKSKKSLLSSELLPTL